MATPGAFDFFEKLIAENESKNRASGGSAPPENQAQGAEPAQAAEKEVAEFEVLASASAAPKAAAAAFLEAPKASAEGDSRESSPSVQNVDVQNSSVKYSIASASSLVDDSKPPLVKASSAEIIDMISAVEVQRQSMNQDIQVVDGLALLDQVSDSYDEEEEGRPSNVAPRSSNSDDEVGFLLEMDVEEGKELPPSPNRKAQKHPRRAATMTNLQKNLKKKNAGPASWFQDSSLKISHRELMVGGPLPKSIAGKDDLIQRLRMFINRLNSNLEQSEEKSKLLKRKYSKKAEEVKESEELVRTLTGRLTEQATVVAQQMKEVQDAKDGGHRDKGSEEAIAAVAAMEAAEAADSGIGRPDSMRNVLAAAAEEGENPSNIKQALQRSQSHQELMKSQQMLISNILPADSFPGFTYKLTIKAPPMGFTLRKDEGGRYAKVASISRNDLKKAGLVPGLQLLSVNQSSLSHMSLSEIKGVLDMAAMPAEIRMRRALSPWTRYQEFTTTKWKTKKAINTWTFYCSRSKPRIVVLEHNQRTIQGKSKRKITIDGEIRYQRKSTDESFKFHLDSDVIYLKIGKNSQGGFKYTLRINELTFEEAKTNFLIMRSEIV